jgi:hypothetical protein
MDIFAYFRSLFQQSRESSPSKPLVHELIVRTEAEKQDYVRWKETLVFKRLRDWLQEQYVLFLHQPEQLAETVEFLHTPSSKGFAVFFSKTRYSGREATHFFDFLKERVLDLEYRVQVSDVRSYERPDWVETVQRHYLKPRPQMNEAGKLRQRFGNITIELILRNDRPFQLRLRATAYKDHLFQEPEDFRQLFAALMV